MQIRLLPTFADLRIKYPSRQSILLHSNDMAESGQALDVNTLHNVHDGKELIQFAVGPKILRKTFLSNTLKAAASKFNSVHARER